MVAAFILSGCQARSGQLPTPAATTTSTPLPAQTATPHPSATPTVLVTSTLTATITPTATLTPLPGLGVETNLAIEALKDFFTLGPAEPIDEQPVQKGTSASGHTTIYLVGEPYLTQAKLTMDISKEEEPESLAYWIVFLEHTTGSGKDALAWVQEHFREAVKNGQAEQMFSSARVTLQVSGANSQILTIKVGQVEK